MVREAPSVGNSSKKFGYNVEKIGGRWEGILYIKELSMLND